MAESQFRHHEVLSRALRPRSLDEVIGQQCTRSVRKMLEGGTLPRTMLLYGDRGLGKTTIARIIAARLNCERAEAGDADPCGECESCQAVFNGRDNFIVREIDCGTVSGVEDIRKLTSDAEFGSGDRERVFILDEVHLVSSVGKTSLLKPLEEPNSNVRWILCTTERHKIPETIVSRCISFKFSPVNVTTLKAWLQMQVESLIQTKSTEFTEFDDDGLELIALLSEGSVRQALSLLEQVLAYGGERLSAAIVQMVAGRPSANDLAQFVTYVIEGNLSKADLLLGQIYTDEFRDALFSYLYREFIPRQGVASVDRRAAQSLIRATLEFVPTFSHRNNRDGLLFAMYDALHSQAVPTAVAPVETRSRSVASDAPAKPAKGKGSKHEKVVADLLKMIVDSAPKKAPVEIEREWDGKFAVVVVGVDRYRMAISATEDYDLTVDLLIPAGAIADILQRERFRMSELFDAGLIIPNPLKEDN